MIQINSDKKSMENVEPIYVDGLDCFEKSILTIINWEYGEYYKAFMHSWGFRYDNQGEKLIGQRLNANNYDIMQDIITHYGIILERYNKTDDKELLDKIHEELQNKRPIIVVADEYYCHWTFNYHKKNLSHVYIIIGITQDNDFMCIDTQPKMTNLILSQEEFILGYKQIYTYDTRPINIEYPNLQTLLDDCIHSGDEKSYLLNTHEMQLFIDDFEHIDFYNEFIDAEIWYSPLFKNINRIYGGRVQFIEFLKHYRNNSFINGFISRLNDAASEWHIIRASLMKIYFNKERYLIEIDKICHRITKVLDLEKELFESLIKTLEEDGVIESYTNLEMINDENSESNGDTFYYVDIQEYLNSKGLYFDKESLIFEDIVPTGSIWNLDGMSFDFTERDNVDNISCHSQEISIAKQCYKKIMLLGYGEWGDQIEELTIIYSDNSNEQIDIMFSDWWKNPEFEEEIAWQSNGINKLDNLIYNGKIFAKSYNIVDSKKTISHILLPECKYIHIFAITLV